MAAEEPKRTASIFAPSFLAWLAEADDPPSGNEADWSGEWRVFSLAEDCHLVLRSWQNPTAGDRPVADFLDRPTALLCAAVLPLEARPTLYTVTGPGDAPEEYAVMVRDNDDPETAAAGDPVGRVRNFTTRQLLALHLAGCFVRSPHSLALLLEAAGPTALRLAGEILHRRLPR